MSTPLLRDYVADLDTPLLMLSPVDTLDLRSFVTGSLVTGGVGSGKSSSSAAEIIRAWLKAGYGGIVLCPTPADREQWEAYCAETGRSQSVIVVGRDMAHRFNFLSYLMTVTDGSVGEAVNVLYDILSAAEGRFERGGSGDQAFWETSTKQLLTMSIAPIWAAYGRLDLAELIQFVLSRPTSGSQLDPKSDWLRTSFWAHTMRESQVGAFPLSVQDYETIRDYWTSKSDMLAADQKTAANITKTLSGKLSPFQMGRLRTLFASDSTYVPELAIESGAVIILDLSPHEWGEEGVFAQHIVKTLWQKAMQRRQRTADMRPSFCVCDECQLFIAPSDQSFASSSRATRALILYISQNLPGIYSRLGSNSRDTADALLGNLAIKIAHAQPCPVTAEWHSKMISKAVVFRRSYNEGANSNTGTSSSHGSAGNSSTHGTSAGSGSSRGMSVNETVDYLVQPGHFTTLLKGGGPERASEAIVFEAGRRFAYTGSTWTPALFSQVPGRLPAVDAPSRLRPAILAVLALAGQRWVAWAVFLLLLFSAGLSGRSILDMIGPMLLWAAFAFACRVATRNVANPLARSFLPQDAAMKPAQGVLNVTPRPALSPPALPGMIALLPAGLARLLGETRSQATE